MKSAAQPAPALSRAPYAFPADFNTLLTSYEGTFNALPNVGVCFFSKMQTLVALLRALEHVIANPNDAPFPYLTATLNAQMGVLKETQKLIPDMTMTEKDMASPFADEESRMADLFETAWTTYSDAVYDHSITLVEDRLKLSGFDAAWFKGKRCFDGGCGTGRLALAMAKMGASEVVAMDIGQESLDFFQKQLDRHGVKNVTLRCGDVSNLKDIPSESFDFVASNGVLHHTGECLRGVKDHYRITKKGGGIFWLYLYGAGGFYWEIYDRMRAMIARLNTRDIRQALTIMKIREGIIYTFIDNMMAPRTYYYETDIVDMLSAMNPLTFKHQSGPMIYDDMSRYTATKYGKDILGPEGEVRIAITKK